VHPFEEAAEPQGSDRSDQRQSGADENKEGRQ
jgi:hypothetical protein